MQPARASPSARSCEIVHPHGPGRVYPSLPDHDLVDWRRAYHGANERHLIDVKTLYDGDNLFWFHPLAPADEPIPRRD